MKQKLKKFIRLLRAGIGFGWWKMDKQLYMESRFAWIVVSIPLIILGIFIEYNFGLRALIIELIAFIIVLILAFAWADSSGQKK